MKMIARRLVFVALMGALAWPALARHHGPHGAQGMQGADLGQTDNQATGQFDYYLMSLSWSPTYCLTHPQDTQQCGGKGFGFVLHGLWPQYSRGGFPHDCSTSERLTPQAIAFGQTVFPSAKLISHEWRKHGTCSGLSALSYFKAGDHARVNVQVPDALQSPEKTLQMSAADIAQAFVRANPGTLKLADLVVACSGPELSEVRVCLSKDLSPQACGKGVKNSCRSGLIRIPASR